MARQAEHVDIALPSHIAAVKLSDVLDPIEGGQSTVEAFYSVLVGF